MSRTKRVWNIIGAVFMIQSAFFLMLIPEAAFLVISAFVGLLLVFYGIKYLVYYLTHAQHMVGGKWFLHTQ